MTTKVIRTLNYRNYESALRDLSTFLDFTGNFSKKFYSMEYSTSENEDEPDRHHTHILAVAISRDILYKIRWKILCKYHSDLDKWKDNHYARTFDSPMFGYLPADDKTSELFFPHKNLKTPDYTTIFDEHSFIEVDTIDDTY